MPEAASVTPNVQSVTAKIRQQQKAARTYQKAAEIGVDGLKQLDSLPLTDAERAVRDAAQAVTDAPVMADTAVKAQHAAFGLLNKGIDSSKTPDQAVAAYGLSLVGQSMAMSVAAQLMGQLDPMAARLLRGLQGGN